ncbi:cell wall elongation regulator TseB-like domain-containing protein [Virgibacillus sp. FSP13]
MRIKQYSQSIVPNWLKWILLVICLVLISCLIYIGFLYHSIQESKNAGFSDTKERVLENTELTEIDRISKFQGEKTYHILFGNTKDQDEKIVFVPIQSKSEKITIIDASDILREQNVIKQWQEQCNKCELIDVTPAMVDNKALWEVTYKDSSDRYTFDYLSIYDGTRFQQIRLKSMFN